MPNREAGTRRVLTNEFTQKSMTRQPGQDLSKA